MPCSDWRQRLRNASFRGARFWVDQDQFEGGRRTVVHEFPHKEHPYLEDLGQQARRYQVTAYTVGDSADSEARALMAACTARGSASLVLPIFGSLRAACLEISTDRSKDRQGYVAFKLTFVEEGSGPGPFAIAALARQVEVRAASIAAPLAAAFCASFQGLDVPDFVHRAAADLVREFAVDLDVTRSRTAIADGQAGSALRRDVQALYDDAPALVRQGAIGNRIEQTVFVAQQVTMDDTGLATRSFRILTDLRTGAAPIDAARALGALAEFETSEPDVPLVTLNRRREAANRESLLALFRRSALVQWAVAVTQRPYESRRDAIAARARVAERFEAELNRIGAADQFEVYHEMSRVMGDTVAYLSSLTADLAPVIAIDAMRSLPAVYWAARLYDDATRGQELWRRNGVKHPTFMPPEFEALAA